MSTKAKSKPVKYTMKGLMEVFSYHFSMMMKRERGYSDEYPAIISRINKETMATAKTIFLKKILVIANPSPAEIERESMEAIEETMWKNGVLGWDDILGQDLKDSFFHVRMVWNGNLLFDGAVRFVLINPDPVSKTVEFHLSECNDNVTFTIRTEHSNVYEIKPGEYVICEEIVDMPYPYNVYITVVQCHPSFETNPKTGRITLESYARSREIRERYRTVKFLHDTGLCKNP